MSTEAEREYLWPEALIYFFKRVSELTILPSEKKLEVEVEKVEPRDLNGKLICGVDGSHAGVELSGFYFGAAVAMAYSSDWKVIRDEDPIFIGDIHRFTSIDGNLWLSLEEVRYVFHAARLAVERKNVHWCIIDGPLLLYPPLIDHARSEDGWDLDKFRGYKDALYATASEILRFFKTCRESGTKIFGLVKRVRSSLFDPEKRHRDSAILQKFLRERGNVTKPVCPGRHPSLNLYESQAEKENIKFEKNWQEFFQVIYLRSSRVKPPVRLEVPYWVDPREAAEVVLSLSDPITGIPVHIHRVEGLIRMGNEILKSIYMRLLARAKSTDDLIPLHGEEFLGVRWEGA